MNQSIDQLSVIIMNFLYNFGKTIITKEFEEVRLHLELETLKNCPTLRIRLHRSDHLSSYG